MKFIYFLVVLGTLAFVDVDCSSQPKEEHGIPSVFIDGRNSIAQTDDDYICATMDYDTWTSDISASILNLDLNNKILLNAVKAFAPLKLRVGGTLQNIITYQEVGQQGPCPQFVQNASALFLFNQGCLPLSRWDQLNHFFNKTRAVVVFGLNALAGKTILPNGLTVGAWNPKNAESFIRYTVEKGYNIHGWELGNELSGKGVGATIPADQYASDVMILQNLLQNIYNGHQTKPLVAAPGGFFDNPAWFSKFLPETTKSLQVVTHHVYNLGAGEEKNLTEKILDPSYLDASSTVYKDLQDMLKKVGSPAKAWVGEAGGAYHGGHNLVTNTFVMSFWYLDQLGRAAAHDTKTYCRQALIGGRYGLLNTTSLVPNPDYYSALLWHRLMGRNVLATTVFGPNELRAYTLCSKPTRGITLLLLNFDGLKSFQVGVSTENGPVIGPLTSEKTPKAKAHTREEYHLTAPNGDLHSQTVLLNGNVLNVNSLGEIPHLKGERVTTLDPVTIAPRSIVFVHFPHIHPDACKV